MIWTSVVCWGFILEKVQTCSLKSRLLNICGAESRPSSEKGAKTMAADSLVPSVLRSSASMPLTMKGHCFPEEQFQLFVPSQRYKCYKMQVYLNATINSLHRRHNERNDVSWLFAQPFVQAYIKENIKVPHHWPLGGVTEGCPSQRASYRENVSIGWHRDISTTRVKSCRTITYLWPFYAEK